MKEHRPDRNPGFRLRGAVGALLVFPTLALVALSQPLITQNSWAGVSLDVLGWISFMGGLMMRVWSTLYIGGRKRQGLTTLGPYSICRNPLYVGSLLLALSVGFFLKSFLLVLAIAGTAVFYRIWTVPAEERDLARQFGDIFEQYRRRVPRFWPSFRSFDSGGETVEVRIHGLRLEARRLLIWIWLPIICEIVNHCRLESWWPHLISTRIS